MKCPVDETTLQMAEREGIEIDYCPQCRGVWLDGRELDRIIERAMQREQARRPPVRESDRDRPSGHDRDHDSHDDYGRGKVKRKDRLGFLGDLLGGD